ncbi:CDP-glycerol glycerophosphotransferase family protein [Marinobacter sp. P4B1]|uniref:bifunctional glycosyltransferase/CDP-glycerol:glycerophosphate glycerophosphotransferase n=1 Tax=Marinobacter sp. P4B1 TaxID=1119533 RepID=UPI00071E518A|nr:CDP-glycerol glycerophosphotransferase family protein [Marinobacter sp. P4B1]KRW82140.1 hypothetical protein AQ621_11040 [Marinobacter sp. P4B1]
MIMPDNAMTHEKNSPTISVILPVFNGEDTVTWTIESVVRQTFKDFELLCIDDSSTDGTLDKLRAVAATDSRIRVLENDKNRGLGKTRNYGVENAKGKYLAFIDSDDFYEPDFLEKLYRLAISNDADIAQSAVRYVYNDKDSLYGSPSGLILGEHCKYRIDVDDGLPFVNPQAWNKIYKADLFDGLGYAPICYEDAQILPYLLSRCKKIVVTDDVLFNYNKRFSGLTGDKVVPLSKIDWYLDSLVDSVRPYFEEGFVELVKKWGVGFPRCIIENYKNFLRMLAKSEGEYSAPDKRLIVEKIRIALAKIERIAPKNIFEEYVRASESFYSLMGEPGRGRRRIFGVLGSGGRRLSSLSVIVLESFFSALDRVVPKSGAIWIFSSWGKYADHTLDNPRALYESVKSNSSIKKVVIINSSSEAIGRHLDDGINVSFVHLKSLKALWLMLRAGVLITGYSLHNVFGYRRLSEKTSRKIVQLWHGIPVKKVGLEVDEGLEKHWENEVKKYSILVSSSDCDKNIMVKSFSPEQPDRVKLTGLPRHDFISCAEEFLPVDFQNHLQILRNRVGDRKLILFAPTWRYATEEACMFSESELLQLDALLAKNDAVLGIRLHPNMKAFGINSNFISDNIFHVDDLPDISIILRLASLLISDYSSIYIDYLITDNPVLLYTKDLGSYSGLRGFNYDISDFVPHHELYSDFSKVYEAISGFLGGGSLKDDKYDVVKNRFLRFSAGSANSDRVLGHVQGELV